MALVEKFAAIILIALATSLTLLTAATSSSAEPLTEGHFDDSALDHLRHSPSLLESVTKSLAAPSVVRAEYVQRRFVQGVPKPFVSKGRFLFVRELGSAWLQDTPFRSAHIATNGGLLTKQFRGDAVEVLRAPENPVTDALREMLGHLFSGQIASVPLGVQVTAIGTPNDWTLGVEPYSPDLKRAVTGVIIAGGASLQRLTLRHPEGDIVKTEFLNVTLDTPPTISDEERALFE